MPPRKNYSEVDEQRLNTVVHGLTEHVERINSHVSADDQSAAWHELERLLAFLEREVRWPKST